MRAGDRLPDDCNAVIDAEALTLHGGFAEATESVAPGTHVRLAGHDVAPGLMLAAAGKRMTPELALACTEAGVEHVDVAAAAVHVSFAPGPVRAWLEHRLAGLRCVPASSGDADPVLRAAPADAPPRLALLPGETGWITRESHQIIVDCPVRFDGCVAVFLALALPVIANLTGGDVAHRDVTLTRKLSSSVGSTELALFDMKGGSAEPLGVADITLAHLARANAFALISPDTEGYASGTQIHVIPFDAMQTGPDL